MPVNGGPSETIASGLPGRPWGIVLDGPDVYVAINDDTNGGVVRIPKAGGKPVLIVEGQSAPTYLALDASFVYWTNAAGDYAVSKASK